MNCSDPEFWPAIVTDLPDDDDHAPLLVDPAEARIVRARDVVEGDVILASFIDGRAEYFTEHYDAHPAEYNPQCRCGVCELIETDEAVVLGGPWESCDPWPADDLVLIVPAWRRHPVGTRVEFGYRGTLKRGRVRGHMLPGWGRPRRADSEWYPGGYSLSGGYLITPAYGHMIRAIG